MASEPSCTYRSLAASVVQALPVRAGKILRDPIVVESNLEDAHVRDTVLVQASCILVAQRLRVLDDLIKAMQTDQFPSMDALRSFCTLEYECKL
jgi:hypothetical protein